MRVHGTLAALLSAATVVLVFNLPVRAGEGDSAAWTPPLYAFCVEVGVPGMKPRSLAEQVAMLHELGFDGAAYPLWLGDQLDKNLETLDRAGLALYMVETAIDLKSPERPWDPRMPAAIARLKGRPVTICVPLIGLKPGDSQGMDPAVRILRELADLTAKSGLRVSIYNHVDQWAERIPFALEVAKNVDRPNVGVNFNLCHWLKVEGSRDYRPLIRQNADKIFTVTLCGAEVGAETWTNGLIQPLDQGDFDNRQLLATLREAGYRGPIGLMCYGVPGDAQEHLARSMKVWKSWQADWTKQP